MSQKVPTIMLKCDCFGHALEVERDEEFNRFNLCIWERGYGNKYALPWFWKLKQCWQILTEGHLWSDQVILSRDNADELVKFLTT